MGKASRTLNGSGNGTLTREERRIGLLIVYPPDIKRPQTRGDCVDGERPCPFVSCRHHLYLDVNGSGRTILLNFPDVEPGQLEHSCSLDVADEGEHTLERVGEFMNVTRERVRQMEVLAATEARATAETIELLERKAG